jgi:hypothetical protein
MEENVLSVRTRHTFTQTNYHKKVIVDVPEGKEEKPSLQCV